MATNIIPTITAREATIKWASSAVTFDGTNPVGSETYAFTLTQAKNMTITPPKGDTEKVDLLGREATTLGAGVPVTGSFQNAIFDEKSWSEAKISGTVIVTADYTNTPVFEVLVSGAGSAVGSYVRYPFGSYTTGQTRVKTGAIVVTLDNGTERMDILLNAPLINFGDIKPTGADGHFEMDFEAMCLPKNFVIDMKT